MKFFLTDKFLLFCRYIFPRGQSSIRHVQDLKSSFLPFRHKTNRRTGKKTLNANDLISRRQRILKSPSWISIFFPTLSLISEKGWIRLASWHKCFSSPIRIFCLEYISPPSYGCRKARFNDVYLAKVALVCSPPRKEWFSFYALWIPAGIVLSRKFIKSQISRFTFGWVVFHEQDQLVVLFALLLLSSTCCLLRYFRIWLGRPTRGTFSLSKNIVDLSRVCLSIFHH